eukprot:Nk52_evm55s151 gene=Nk52_evmTU55s151
MSTHPVTGLLEVTVFQAENVIVYGAAYANKSGRRFSTLPSQQLYCKLRVDGVEECARTGTVPSVLYNNVSRQVWGEIFYFKVFQATHISLQCYEHDEYSADEICAHCVYYFGDLIVSKDVCARNSMRPQGHIKLRLKFTPCAVKREDVGIISLKMLDALPDCGATSSKSKKPELKDHLMLLKERIKTQASPPTTASNSPMVSPAVSVTTESPPDSPGTCAILNAVKDDSLVRFGSNTSCDSLQPSILSLRSFPVTYTVLITKARARNLTAKHITHTCNPYLMYTWDNRHFRSHVVHGYTYPCWDDEQSFYYEGLDSDLGSKRLTIECFNYISADKSELIGSVSLTLQSIIEGPVHHDLQLMNGKKKTGRLAVNISMQELSNLMIGLTNVTCELEEVVQPTADCSFQLDYRYTGTKGASASSVQSHKCREPVWLDDIGNDDSFPDIAVESTLMELHANSLDVQLKVNTSSSMPPLTVYQRTTSRKVSNSSDTGGSIDSFNMNDSNIDGTVLSNGPDLLLEDNVEEEEATLEPVGECWIAFAKYVHIQDVTENADGNMIIETHFKEKLFRVGKHIGNISGVLTLLGMPRHAQMVGGVRTETGISAISPVVVGHKNNAAMFSFRSLLKSDLPSEVDQLNEMFKELTRMHKHQKGENSKKSEMLLKMLSLLHTSHKDSMISYVYNNEASLYLSKQIFINIWRHLLEHADGSTYKDRRKYYAIMQAILRRSELDLSHAGRPISEYTEHDTELALLYNGILYQTLAYALKKLNRKTAFDVQYEFCVRTLVISFFHLPSFQKVILDAVLPKHSRDIPIKNWRGTEWDIDHLMERSLTDSMNEVSVNAKGRGRSVSVSAKYTLAPLDWRDMEEHLDKHCIKTKSMVIEEQKKLLPAGPDQRWLQQFETKSQLFFFFFEQLVIHVYDIMPDKDNIVWHEVPGYSILLKALLLEMMERPVEAYPDSLMACAEALLVNTHLLNVLINIAFTKTNAFNLTEVAATLDYLDAWFDSLSSSLLPDDNTNLKGDESGKLIAQAKERKGKVQVTFDFSFFVSGLEILLSSEHVQIISNTLRVIVNHIDIFDDDRRERLLVDVILKKHFYDLFLHYDITVRYVFHLLIIYRIFHCSVCGETEGSQHSSRASSPGSIMEGGARGRRSLIMMAKDDEHRAAGDRIAEAYRKRIDIVQRHFKTVIESDEYANSTFMQRKALHEEGHWPFPFRYAPYVKYSLEEFGLAEVEYQKNVSSTKKTNYIAPKDSNGEFKRSENGKLLPDLQLKFTVQIDHAEDDEERSVV